MRRAPQLTDGFRLSLITILLAAAGCQQVPPPFLPEYSQIDILIENGAVLDGLGNGAIAADVAIVGDRIVFVGDANISVDDLANRVVKRIDGENRNARVYRFAFARGSS
jgi:hypothetical protein